MINKIKFLEYKNDILEALQNKGDLGISEEVSLMDGFIDQPICNSIGSGNIMNNGGPTMPMIALIGNSGRIYFFALKVLLPNINL